MDIKKEIKTIETLKELALELGKEDKERELKYSDYMEPEYQEPDLNRGVAIIEGMLQRLIIEEKIREEEEAEYKASKREEARWKEETYGEA